MSLRFIARAVGVVLLVMSGTLLILIGWNFLTHGRTPTIHTPQGIAELERVQLGSVAQWILIRGDDSRQPVVLVLHGGPGMPQMYLAHLFQRDLEERFVMVHWDRRGAGKSFHSDLRPQDISLPHLLSDTVELAELLRARFHQPKILLVGHSWGSYLGMLTIKSRPNLFSAFVGVGQLTALGEENRIIQERFIRAEAMRRGDQEAIADLAKPRPPLEKWLFRYGAEVQGMTSWSPLMWAGIRAPEYTVADVRKLVRGLSLYAKMPDDGLPQRLIEAVPSVEVPCYFFTGRHDYTDPFELTQRFAAQLQAPHSEMVWFEHSAHFPFLEEPRRFAEELDRVAREVRAK